MLITKCLTRHASHFLVLLSLIKHVQLLGLTFGQNSEVLSKEPEDGLLALSVQEMRQRPKGKLYFAIAAPPGSQTYTRAFNKTLFNITQNYILKKVNKERYNITLDTLTIDLPDNGTFSAKLLQKVCDLFDGKHVVAVLVIGESPAAFMVSYAAKHAAVPVLWAREHSRMLTEFENSESSFLEVQLTPEGRELVQALRGLLLQAHWHTYTLLANEASATALRRPDLWAALAAAPLHPTLVALPNMPQRRPTTVFRKLADISRLTRGVIVLFSDRVFALRILENARRLNMMDGHFVWIWINTASTTTQSEFYGRDPDQDLNVNVNYSEYSLNSDSSRFKRASNSNSKKKSDTSDTHQLSFLLKNNNDDSFLNFDHNEGVESSKLKNRQEPLEKTTFSKRGSAVITSSDLPIGLLSLRPLPIRVDRHLVKGAVKLLVVTLKQVLDHCPEWLSASILHQELKASCWRTAGVKELNFSTAYARELRSATADALAGKRTLQENSVEKVDKSLVSSFEILNLVPEPSSKHEDHSTSINKTGVDSVKLKWKRVGLISGRSVRLDTIIWPGGDLSVAAVSANARSVFRIVTALSPPFVMESELDEDGQCLRGLPCHRVLTHDKDNLTLVFNELDRLEEEHEEAKTFSHFGHFQHLASSGRFHPFYKYKYRTNCCYGLAMDLLENIAHELEFDFHLYIVADGLFGSKMTTDKKSRRDVGRSFWVNRLKKEDGTTGNVPSSDSRVEVKWNGIVGDLISEAAHMSFAALSVSSVRSEVIDFSVPYFFAGVSSLAAPQQKSEIPLMAFLLPFSTELWIAIFTSLNITAIAVAIYEWLSPFGLNPWGRQRSKNFSMSSALWVMWGLLCGHLVAFKAPKSWPNKFLINVWGGFSVIFVASYTANIAALIAGLFFRNTGKYYDRTFLNQRVGAPRASAAEYYVQKVDPMLWEHMLKYSLRSIEEGIERLRNGTLDIVIADTPILDYYRATDHLCKLQKIGTLINEDTYAVGMTKGFPLRDSISAVIAKYASNGYLDILQEKWYGGLPCFKVGTEALAQPKPLGFAAVTGVFILLGVGMVLGLLILLLEHLFFRYTLPILRDKPKNSIWRSRNIMFFSQKLYRFINCVELVSPHHAARELVHTIRQGQITSLFQKSVKRKEHEQRRRRRSKAQFFEMIQEIRSSINRQQQESRPRSLECVTEDTEYQLTAAEKKSNLSPSILRRTFMRTSPKTENPPKLKSPTAYFNKQFFSPRSKTKPKTTSTLNVRRFSSDSVFSSQTLHTDRSSSVGRRLSKDVSCLSNSPPDINSRRSSYLDTVSTGSKLAGKSPVLSIENVSVCSTRVNDLQRKLSDAESIGKKLATLPLYVGEPFNKQHLHPQYSATLGKSDQTLNKPEKRRASRTLSFDNQTTKSYQNIPDSEREGNSNALLQVSCEEKSNLSDDEIARRNRLTVEQLQQQLGNKRKPSSSSSNSKQTFKTTTQPPIIQVEDTTQKPAVIRRHKTRHRSLGDSTTTSTSLPRKKKLEEQSHSLDGNPSMTKNRRRCHEHDLPPAPPPPNCSPRNSDGGKSPLDRLSKDELVNLWRSSESELRSHILKAIRDKETVDPP